MEDLDNWANDAMWDSEVSRLSYCLPLDLAPKDADDQGEKLKAGIPDDELYKIMHYWCAKSPLTHRAAFKNAIDFLVLDESPIIAAGGGRVVEVQQHSNEWGDDLSFRDKLNYITIQHSATEFSQYCHLAQNSVRDALVHIGGMVKEGQVIGTVGKTGLTDRDHLHFIVFRLDNNPSPFGFKSLVPKWK